MLALFCVFQNIQKGLNMAIRGFNDKSLEKELRQILDRQMDSYVQRFITAGNKLMKQSYIDGIGEWYSQSGLPRSTFNHIKKHVHSYKTMTRSTNKVTLMFHGYLDGDGVESEGLFPSVRKWARDHSEPWHYMKNPNNPERSPLSMSITPSEYVINLQWQYGVIGLPNKARNTGTGWINPRFRSHGWSMEHVTGNAIRDAFDKLKEDPSTKLQKRQTTQGAGINSSNRAGMDNLSKNRSKADRKA